jgi:PPK2 family polyphosphate:nucleotide phosphotransferase
MKFQDIREAMRVPPDKKVDLSDYDPVWVMPKKLKRLSKEDARTAANAFLARTQRELADAQDLLYASDTCAILLILQGMDASGKDSTIKHVMSGVNPQGCEVYSFKQPSPEELDHNFLWRCAKVVPRRGHIGIFNRSYYEEVLVVRVHKELLDNEQLPLSTLNDKDFWKKRYDDINNFERHLTRNGTVILKCFLNISKAEQKKRFLKRLSDPTKHWKFSIGDVREREHWDEYQEAYEDALQATSTEWAPWYVVPSNHKWIARAMVARLLTDAIHSLHLKYPEPTAEQRAGLEEARQLLENE